MAEDWRTYGMRQRIIQQIDDYLKQTPEASKRTAADLENSIFLKATKKDEYLQFVSKIIMYLKEQTQNTNPNSSNLTAMLSGQHGTNTVQSSIGQGVTSGGQMTLVNSGNQIMHNQSQMGGGSQLAHNTNSGGQITHVGLSSGQTMGPGGMVAGNRMPHAIGTIGSQGDMSNWQTQQRGRRPNMTLKHPVMANMGGQVGKINATMPMQMPIPNDQGVNPMNVGQMPRQMQTRVPSPSFNMGVVGAHPRQGVPNSNIPSPVPQQHNLSFVSPSPSSAVPSPASAGRSMNQHGVPSPGSVMINTPGPQPSPASSVSSMEDRAYIEKAKQLQDKYLITLREVAQKLCNSDIDSARKVRNLLEVIENPHQRAPNGMEMLKRCEIVLERIEIQHGGSARNDANRNLLKDNNPVGVLFDAINLALKSPFGYHTIHRTLSPALKTLMGPDLEPPPFKKMKNKEFNVLPTDAPVISVIIQGEVARLPPRFKANLDSHQPIGSDNLTLICQLDDPNLPCIPPISLIIPPNYPDAPPKCRLSKVDYNTTPFLKKIKEIMLNRQFHLPEICSITMLLEAWEMSVRRACSNESFTPDAIDPLVNLSIFS